MTLKFLLCIPFLVLLCVSLALSETYYVSASGGDDENAGTEEKPFKTIQKAADVMVAGDVCLIDDGVYRETITLKTSGTQEEPITFKAMEEAEVIISGTESLEGVNWVGYFDYDRTWSDQGEKTFQSQGVPEEGKNYSALYMDGEMITKVNSPKELDEPSKWYLDAGEERVRILLWPPKVESVSDDMDEAYNTPLNYEIEAKLRDFAFIAEDIDYIVLSGITLFAVDNKLDNCDNWTINTE